MIQTLSYSIRVSRMDKEFRDTLSIYREAVDYLIGVVLERWDAVLNASYTSSDGKTLSPAKARQRVVEHLIHGTKNRVPVYDFDRRFINFPCYLRRDAITEAVGKVSSYLSNLENWVTGGKKGKKPGCPRAGFIFPCFYKGNMCREKDDGTVMLKLYMKGSWGWASVKLNNPDLSYVLKHCADRKRHAPSLKKRGKRWALEFAFEEKGIPLHNKSISDQRILAVDLGISSACACSVMSSDGTVAGRKFLRLLAEEDRLRHALNRLKKAQSKGNLRTPRLWGRVNGLNTDIARKTAKFIVDTAVLFGVDTIVFEYLDLSGKKKGKFKKQRLHLWKAREVQDIVTRKAHALGMRISRVCAWNTSKLAFDGSGEVERNINGNYSICKFQTGKVYNCDLSASYNIGSRYFIRELLKACGESQRLELQAKVPEVSKRSTCTLSTLVSMHAVLQPLAAVS